MNGALINGLEARVSDLEDKLEDIDARTSEEADNALNEREMDRFIMSGNGLLIFGVIDILCWVGEHFQQDDSSRVILCQVRWVHSFSVTAFICSQI